MLAEPMDGNHGEKHPKTGDYVPEGIPFIMANNLLGGTLDYNNCAFISAKQASTLVKGLAKPGDVLLTHKATIGRTAIVPNDYDLVILTPQVTYYRPIQGIDNQYLKYYFDTSKFQNLFKNWAGSGSTRAYLGITAQHKLPIVLPDIKTQKRIASILSSLDDKIEVNRKINENLEQQAQALFKSWLKKCEDEVTIGDLSLNITDYTKCEQKQVVLINSSDVTEGRFEHHNLSENKNLKGHFKKRFQKGDILYSQVRPRNRHWGYCTFNADNYLASTQLMVIRNRPDVISSILLYQYIIENKVWMDFTLRTETRSGTFPQGNYEDLSAIKVPFGADVKEITNKLEIIYTLIYKNEQESRRLAELRDTLLPKLMSGELKVNEIEK